MAVQQATDFTRRALKIETVVPLPTIGGRIQCRPQKSHSRAALGATGHGLLSGKPAATRGSMELLSARANLPPPAVAAFARRIETTFALALCLRGELCVAVSGARLGGGASSHACRRVRNGM